MITEEGIISYLGYLASTNKTYQREFNNTPIHGKIYRIVSQLNISVTEVDESKLESMDLLVSNFPQTIKLYGNNGEYYPIEAATKDNHIESKEYVQIGHTKDFKRKKIMVTLKDEQGNPLKDENGREKQVETYTVSADLSSFLLPSELGRKVRVRLNYKPGTLVDDEGNVLENQSVEYDIRPSKDYLLSLENSEVYKSGVTTAKDDEGTKVVIYDHINDAFYSVANVKVNISGKFEKIFAEVSEVDVNIEVCPAFEASHEYDF